MDNLGNEVIIRVKEAIRAKLREMNANSSDEIIDYIMLLVTTKKSTTELAKSIDFLMENNTAVFVKWLSTIIKKLQQVTVSASEKNMSDNFLTPKDCSLTVNKKDILIYETSNIKLDDFHEQKKDCVMFDSNICVKNTQIFDREKNEKCPPKLNASKSAMCDENEMSPLPVKSNKIKEKITFCSVETIKTKNNLEINKTNISIKNDHKATNSGVSKKIICDGSEKIDSKIKRPRISINSGDEDDNNVGLKLPVTTKKTAKEIQKELPKKNIKKSMSQVIVVKPQKSKIDIHETKKMNMNDLVTQRVDHQRGALAFDIAFKYIQQQIGASDKEIAVIKKWRDYAVEILRSNKKV